MCTLVVYTGLPISDMHSQGKEGSMIYTPLTDKAMKLAYKAHDGQLDRNDAPYVFHPFHLAEQMTDEITCAAALLHDVVEDTDITLDDLAKEYPAEVVELVRLLTHDEDVDYFDYVRALKHNPQAVQIKLADLAHNSDESRLTIPELTTAEQRAQWQEKYAKARRILLDEED